MRVTLVFVAVVALFGCSKLNGTERVGKSTAANHPGEITDYGDCRDLGTTGYGCCDDFGTPIKCQTYPMHVLGEDGTLYAADCLCAATHVCFAKDDLQNAQPISPSSHPQETCAPHGPGPIGQFP